VNDGRGSIHYRRREKAVPAKKPRNEIAADAGVRSAITRDWIDTDSRCFGSETEDIVLSREREREG